VNGSAIHDTICATLVGIYRNFHYFSCFSKNFSQTCFIVAQMVSEWLCHSRYHLCHPSQNIILNSRFCGFLVDLGIYSFYAIFMENYWCIVYKKWVCQNNELIVNKFYRLNSWIGDPILFLDGNTILSQWFQKLVILLFTLHYWITYAWMTLSSKNCSVKTSTFLSKLLPNLRMSLWMTVPSKSYGWHYHP